MNCWNQNAYLKIWNFASDVHQNQKHLVQILLYKPHKLSVDGALAAN